MSYFLEYSIIFILFLTNILTAQKSNYVTIKPEKPKIGDKITVTYDPFAKEAVMKDAEEITMEVLLNCETGYSVLNEMKMKKNGNVFKGTYNVKDEDAAVLFIRFIQNEKIDDNEKNLWKVMIYGKNKKPVMGAHYILSRALNNGLSEYFTCNRDKEAAKDELKKELELYPNNTRIIVSNLTALLKEKPDIKTKEIIKKELLRLYDDHKNDEKQIRPMLNLIYDTELVNDKDLKEKFDEIVMKGSLANPNGLISEFKYFRDLFQEKDRLKKNEILEKMVKNLPCTKPDYKQIYNLQIIGNLYNSGKIDEAYEKFESLQDKDVKVLLDWTRTSLASGKQTEKAVKWARENIELCLANYPALKNPFFSSKNAFQQVEYFSKFNDGEYRNAFALKPSWMHNKLWNEHIEYTLELSMDAYAQGLFKLGKTLEAEKAYEAVFTMNRGRLSDVNDHYIECLIKNEKYEKAYEVSEICMKIERFTDNLINHFKSVYIKLKGSDSGFSEMIEDMKKNARNNVKLLNEEKKLINKPATEFSLKKLDGKTINLSDLKGKVVLLDFWATWCGPCIGSFETLQKIYDKYKNNQDVAILAINMNGGKITKETEKSVMNIMEKYNYTFPVALDDSIWHEYNIAVIPTRIMIDKEGKIQFKSTGFLDKRILSDEIEAQLEILLSKN